jgi:N-acetylneuraminic acid mutarotase
MKRELLQTPAFGFSFALVACGGSAKSPSGDVPLDAGTETSVPVVDAALDTAAPAEDSAPAEAGVTLVGPGVMLFAGWGEAPLSDTWNWNGHAWAELPIAGPSLRDDQAMIATGDSRVLLFGGEGLGTPYLGDTWVWTDGKGWTQRMVSGPSPRAGAALAALGGKIYLYGGTGSGGDLKDTWVWDDTSWTQVPVSGPTPGTRYGHSMATLGNTIVLFGNIGGYTDTWTFDGTTWTLAAPASAGPTGDPKGLFESRCFQTLATLGDKVILFGGEQDANHVLNDTWAWNGTAWAQLSIANPPPARFHGGTTTYDGKIVLFGGAGAIPTGPGFLDDTWTFDGTTWTEVAMDGPTPRYGYVLAAH